MKEPKLTFEKNMVKILMPDGREGSHPLDWFPKLDNANSVKNMSFPLLVCIGRNWTKI